MLVSLSEQVTHPKIIFWKYIMTIQTSSKVCSFFNSFIHFCIIHFSISNVANNVLHAFEILKPQEFYYYWWHVSSSMLQGKAMLKGLILYFSTKPIDSFARSRDFLASLQSRLPFTCHNLSWEKRLCLTSGSASTRKGGLVKTKLHCDCTHFKRHSERFSERIKFIYAQW